MLDVPILYISSSNIEISISNDEGVVIDKKARTNSRLDKVKQEDASREEVASSSAKASARDIYVIESLLAATKNAPVNSSETNSLTPY